MRPPLAYRLVEHTGRRYLITTTPNGDHCSCRHGTHWQGVPCPHLTAPHATPATQPRQLELEGAA